MNYGDNPTPNLMYTGVLSDKTVLEARFAGFWGDDHAGPILDGEPRVQAALLRPRHGPASRAASTTGTTTRPTRPRPAPRSPTSPTTSWARSHDFKFGVQYVNGGVHDAVAGYNDLIYTYTTYTGLLREHATT